MYVQLQQYAHQLFSALAHVHSRGVIHRFVCFPTLREKIRDIAGLCMLSILYFSSIHFELAFIQLIAILCFYLCGCAPFSFC